MSQQDRLLEIALVIDELKHDDAAVRLSSFQQIDLVAAALGPDRTRAELLPYLQSFVGEDEDEILITLSEKLSGFLPLVGGAAFAFCILSVLESLARMEEALVHEAALHSLVKLCGQLDSATIRSQVVPSVERLSDSPFYACRRASTALYPVVYPHVDDNCKAQLRRAFISICSDESPMIRRAAASQFGKFVDVLDVSEASELFDAFIQISKDHHDSVRLLCVEACIALAKKLQGMQLNMILACADQFCVDSCWRVRYMVADQFPALCAVFGAEVTRGQFAHHFASLLQDVEAEVRTAAASKVSDVSLLLEKGDVLMKLVPAIILLVSDESEFVRSSIASDIMGLCDVLNEQQMRQILLPLFVQLLQDSTPEVRLNIISKLDKVANVLGHDELSRSLMPAIIDLALDRNWRIRLAILEHVPSIARQLGVDFFEHNLSEVCVTWLGDEVFTIREAAVQNVTEVIGIFGVEWAVQYMLPRIRDFSVKVNYLYRMTSLFASIDLIDKIRDARIIYQLLPSILGLCKDPIPNVRFNAAKALKKVIEVLPEPSIVAAVSEALPALIQDTDIDVQFYAQEALESMPSQ